MSSRYLTAQFEGRTYEIPEMWVAGFCREGNTVEEAVAYWHTQTILGEHERGERELTDEEWAAILPEEAQV